MSRLEIGRGYITPGLPKDSEEDTQKLKLLVLMGFSSIRESQLLTNSINGDEILLAFIFI